jgi:hypothetical protein
MLSYKYILVFQPTMGSADSPEKSFNSITEKPNVSEEFLLRSSENTLLIAREKALKFLGCKLEEKRQE